MGGIFSAAVLSAHKGESQCFMCGKSFSETAIKKGYLKIHIQVVHEKRKRFKCMQCDSCFGIRKSLKKHVLAVHDKIKPHKCPHCDSSFFNNTNLKTHIACVHDEVRPFKCNLCESAFHSLRGLKRHVSGVHDKIRPHQCSQCDKSFSEAGKLRTHISTVHEGKKLFECTVCEKSFTQNGHLKSHVESVHEGRKPFSCSKCKKSFSRNRELKNHILAIHEGTPFQCSICDKNFSGNSELKRHTLLIHKDKKKKIIENSDDENQSSENRHIATVHEGEKQMDKRKELNIISDVIKTEAESDGNGSTGEEVGDYSMSFLEIKQENLNESNHNFGQNLENHKQIDCPKIIKEEVIAESGEDFGIWSYDNEEQYDPSISKIKTEEQEGNFLDEIETYDQTENSDPLEDNFQIDDFYDDYVVEEFLDENITDGFDDTEY